MVVVGQPDGLTAGLQRLAKELGIDSRIRWINDLEPAALEKQLFGSFCLVSASFMEGFDYPLLEAQAFGLPTLASDIPVHRELHEGNSLFFRFGDNGISLGNELKCLSRDNSLWHQLSKAGLINAQKFTLAGQVKEITEVLKAVSI